MKGEKEMFTRYANLTEEQQDRIVDAFRYARDVGRSDPGHAAACAACNGLSLTTKQWNSKIGSDAFAAALTTLVMKGEINLSHAN